MKIGLVSGVYVVLVNHVKRVNSEVAYELIRERILAGKFKPGAALMTEELAVEIGVSRTPVRDALRKLETDGLVIIQPHIGARVKQMKEREFREMCEFRLALELHAAGLAATNRTEGDLREMRLSLRAMRALTSDIASTSNEVDLIGSLVREDVRFHVAVINASRNELLKREILRLHLIKRVVLGPIGDDRFDFPRQDKKARDQHREEVIQDHQLILDTITKKQAEEAKHAIQKHIQDMMDILFSTHFPTSAQEEQPRELSADELVYTP